MDFSPRRPLISQMDLRKRQGLAGQGYKVLPDDCSAVRVVGQYGYLIRPPADIRSRRSADGFKWRSPPIAPDERLLSFRNFTGTYVDGLLSSGCPKLCCGIRFDCSKQVGIMMKDLPNAFYNAPGRTFLIWEGVKPHEDGRTPNTYAWLPGYEAFAANCLLHLVKPTVIKRGDPIGIVVPVVLPEQFALSALEHPTR